MLFFMTPNHELDTINDGDCICFFLFFSCASQTSINTTEEPVVAEEEKSELYSASFAPTDSSVVMEPLTNGQAFSSLYSHTLFFSSDNEVYVQKEPEEPTFIGQGHQMLHKPFKIPSFLA